jgi:hypothetical protein
MLWFKPFQWKKILVLCLVLVLVGFIVFLLNQAAQAQGQTDIVRERPRGAVSSSQTDEAGGRGPSCSLAESNSAESGVNNESIKFNVALMPVEKVDLNNDNLPDVRYVGGTTVTERPTLWFYIPFVSEASSIPDAPVLQIAQFTLLNLAKQPIWHELIAYELTQTPQLIEYVLPYTLETDQPYNWYFSIICAPEKPSRNSVLRGWVQRIEPSPQLQSTLANTPIPLLPEYEYQAYVDNGIWFEALNSLIKRHRQLSSSSRFRDDLNDLLVGAGIPEPEQFDFLNPAKIMERKAIATQSQLPARM